MQSSHPEPTEPRIIRKKKVQAGGHGGAWKVAYADFVTAMMALFIVLWIMSQSQSIRQNVAQYFKNPGLLPGAGGLMESSDIGGKMPTPGHSQELQTPSPLQPDLAAEKGSFEEVKKRITEVIAQMPELSRLRDQVSLEISREGLRIELLERENSHFFDIGSAELKGETKKILAIIARELGQLPNQIIIEGHTDSRPYGSPNYTNWELSADRANAARRILESSGVRPGQVIAIRGSADRELRNPKDPMDFQNRRVSILLKFHDPATETPPPRPEGPSLNPAPGKPGGGPALPTAPPSPGGLLAPDTKTPPGQPGKEAGAKGAKPGGGGTGGKPPGPPADQNREDKVLEELRKLIPPTAEKVPAFPEPRPSPAAPRDRLGW